MSSLAPQNSRSPSPAPSVGVSMPAVPNTTAQQYQQNQMAMAHMSELKMPSAPQSARQGGGEQSSEGAGLAGPSHAPPPLQVSFWESRNGPVDQIMRHIGNAIVTLLKLFTPKKGI